MKHHNPCAPTEEECAQRRRLFWLALSLYDEDHAADGLAANIRREAPKMMTTEARVRCLMREIEVLASEATQHELEILLFELQKVVVLGRRLSENESKDPLDHCGDATGPYGGPNASGVAT